MNITTCIDLNEISSVSNEISDELIDVIIPGNNPIKPNLYFLAALAVNNAVVLAFDTLNRLLDSV